MTLDNKLDLTEQADLAHEEERLSKTRAIELFEQHMLETMEPGTFDSLSKIHAHLFGDVYDFAGQIRTENISKGSFRFAPILYLEDYIAKIEAMPQCAYDEIIEKYVEMNAAHPFREGNARSMRIWLDQMLKASLGTVVDWSKVDKEDYLLALERSPIKDVEIKVLLKGSLTDAVDDRDMYMKGIDASYNYEGYNVYKADELA